MSVTARQERKARTREALKAAAQRCFAERGYAAVGATEIARTAGVAYGTFYVHFESKEALSDELLFELNSELAARMAPVLAGAGRGALAPVVREAAELFVAHLEANRAFIEWYASRVAASFDVERASAGVNPPMVALLAAALTALAARRGRVLPEAELAAHALLAMWLRVGLRAVGRPAAERAAAIDLLVRMSAAAIDGVTGEGDRR